MDKETKSIEQLAYDHLQIQRQQAQLQQQYQQLEERRLQILKMIDELEQATEPKDEDVE